LSGPSHFRQYRSAASARRAPEQVIQTAINLVDPNDEFSGGPGDVYVQSGRYDLSSAFVGFDVRSYTNLRLNARAQIRVPHQYTGAVFQMLSDDGEHIAGVANSIIDGGRITERVPTEAQPGAKWTAFLLKGSSSQTLSGIQFNKIANTEATLAGVGVSIEVDQLLGYVNSNTFEFMRMFNCRVFVSFTMANLQFTTGIPIWANRFVDLQCNCNTRVRTEIGIRNVMGRQNVFDAVKVWDIQNGVAAPGQTEPLTLQVSTQAESTLVIDGILAGGFVNPKNVQNNSTSTTVFP
jgi:hypothetical protein